MHKFRTVDRDSSNSENISPRFRYLLLQQDARSLAAAGGSGWMRGLLESRLLSFLHILPPRPIHGCLDMVTEDGQYRTTKTTRHGDEDEDVYWMDVMIEDGWETAVA
ncbi:hypothetical protein VTN02DRAFT_5102 [Thermoascus thermophilus]